MDTDFGIDYSFVTCIDRIIIWGGSENPYNVYSYGQYTLTLLTPMMSSHIAHTTTVLDENTFVVISGEDNENWECMDLLSYSKDI